MLELLNNMGRRYLKSLSTLFAAALASLALVSPAQAVVYNFAISGDYFATFQIDTSQAPEEFVSGSYATFWDVAGPFPGATSQIADVRFFSTAVDGGLSITDIHGPRTLFVTDGPQLYFGTEANPNFLTGTFALTQYQGSGTYTLTISDAAMAAVPESATWVMMLAGFGMIGVATRRRSTVKTTVTYA